MAPSDPDLPDAVKTSWHRFLESFEPLRPELYRYCRHLTRDPWDAEDLAQDVLARAFVTLGCLFQPPPPNPKAWLFRVASNLWIDRVRRGREIAVAEPSADSAAPERRDTREAAGTLIERLAPRERAALVLKDVFDLTLEEIAEALSTSVGAVKSALHRGRGKLKDPEPEPGNATDPKLLDAFCAAFNARDVHGVTRLLLDTSSVEIVGLVTEYGPDASGDPETGSLYGMLFGDLSADDPRGGVEPRHRAGVRPAAPRCEARLYRGEPILLYWYSHADGEAVRAVVRVETADGHLTRVRQHFFTPDVLAEVCDELGVPYRSNGYRYWW
jgi:RNA polymerase sigma-70 factor (ECF subfamily)